MNLRALERQSSFIVRFIAALQCTMLMVVASVAGAQTLPPELSRGATWLQSQIMSDGSVAAPLPPQPVIARSIQTQSETIFALKAVTGTAPSAVNVATQVFTEVTTETLARQALSALSANTSYTNALVTLIALQNADGGFGALSGHASNPLDTAYALLALRADSTTYASQAQNALAYLATVVPGSADVAIPAEGVNQQDHLFAASYIILAANAWRTQFSVGDTVTRARTWLLAQRNAQSAFPNDPLNALSLLALLTDTQDPSIIDPLLAALRSAQHADGSWSADAYTTALALRAIRSATQPAPSPTTGGVQGSIVDAVTNAALADVSVLLLQDINQSATTNASGAFALSNLNAGTYDIRVSRLGYQSRDINFTITAAQVTNLGAIALTAIPLTATVSGTVRDQNGAALANATVSVSTSSTLTSSTGTYQLTGLNPGPATINVSLSGYDPVSASVTFVGGGTVLFSPTLYPTNTSPTDAQLHGTVVDSVSKLPISGAVVTVGATSQTTGTDGQFSFASLAVGATAISVSASGYTAATLNASLVLGLNEIGNVSLVKAPTTYSLSGVVKDATTGALISGATIAIPTMSLTTNSASNGAYSLTGITQATFTVSVSATSYATRQLPVTLSQLGANTLNIEMTKPAATDISFESVATNKPTYVADEKIELDVVIRNVGIVTASLLVEADVLDPQGRVVYTYLANSTTGWAGARLPNQPIEIAAGASTKRSMDWFMLNRPAGTYQVKARAINGNGLVVATGQTTLLISGGALLRGGLNVDPPLAQFGTNQPVALTAKLLNTGNADIPAGNADLRIVLDTPDPNASASPLATARVFASGDPLSWTKKLIADASGNLYTINSEDRKLLKIDTAGVISVVATLPSEYSLSVVDLALASDGGFWVVTANANVVVKVELTGDISERSFASLRSATAIDVAPNGDLVLTGTYSGPDTENLVEQRIIRLSPTGQETVLWKNGLANPVALVNDGNGNLVVTNTRDNSLNKVSIATGQITPFVTGLNFPQGIARDAAGNFYVANAGTNTVEKVTPTGAVSTFASGLHGPADLRFDANGYLFVSNQSDHTITKISPSGTVELFAQGIANNPQGMKFDAAGNLWIANDDGILRTKDSQDHVSVVATGLSSPRGLAFNAAGEVLVASYSSGTIDKVAGNTRTTLVSGLNGPHGVAVDSFDAIWVTESASSRIRQFDQTGGLLNTFESKFASPARVRVDAAGTVYVLNSGFITAIENGVPRVFFRDNTLAFVNFVVDPFQGGLILSTGTDVYRISNSGIATKLTTSPLPFYVYDVGVGAGGAVLLVDFSERTLHKLVNGATTPFAVLADYFSTVLTDSQGRITVASTSGGVYAVESDGSSAMLDTSALTGGVLSVNIDIQGKLLLSSSGGLYELDRTTGAVSVLFNQSLSDAASMTRDTAGNYFASITQTHELVVYDSSLAVLRRHVGFVSPKDIAWDNGKLWFSDSVGGLFSLLPTGALTKWAKNFLGDYIALDGSEVLGIQGSSVSRWTGANVSTVSVPLDVMSERSGLAVRGNQIAVGSPSTSVITLVEKSTGQVVTTYAGILYPQGLAFDNTGNLLVANRGTGTIARVSAAGKASTLFARTPDPRYLAVDSSGSVWVTSYAGATVFSSAGELQKIAPFSGGLAGIADVGNDLFAIESYASVLRRLNGDEWTAFASGIATPVAVRTAPNDDIFVLNQGNGTIIKYANGTVSAVTGGLVEPYTMDLGSDGAFFVGGAGGKVTLVAPNGGKADLHVARTLGFSIVDGIAMTPSGKLYTNGVFYSPGPIAHNVYEIALEQAVVSAPAGTVVYSRSVPMNGLKMGAPALPVDAGSWLPPYGGDFRIELSRAGVSGTVTNYVHVGSFARSELVAAKTELPPGDQTLPVCLKLDGADFTSISRVDTAQVLPVATIQMPMGLAGDRAGNVYYTTGNGLYRATPGSSSLGNDTLVADGFALAFGLAVDADENFYLPSRNATSNNFELIKVSKSGVTSVVADLGVQQANGVQVDSKGNVLVGSPDKLLKVTQSGAVSTVSTNGLPNPRAIAIDGRDNIYVQNEDNYVSLIKPNGTAYDIFSGSADGNAPGFEGDGYPNIAADCAENFYIAPSYWSRIGQSGEEHTLAQVVARTGKIALLFDSQIINPVLSDIDYLAFDRLGNRIFLWNHTDSTVWSVPVTCGAIGVQAHVVTSAGQKLSGITKAPAASIPLADGRTEYVWSLKDVTAQGEQVCFDATQSNLKLGELRKTLDSGFVTFQNSFSPNDIKMPLDIPFVRAGNLVTLTVATDKGDYAANTSATVTTTLKNAYTRVIAGTLNVDVYDANGIRVGGVTQQGVSIPAGGELPVTGPFGIGRIVAAKYTVKAVLLDNGVEQARAQSDFNVLPDNVAASAVSTVNTDRKIYSASDRVIITSRATSQSANIVLGNLTVMIRVYDSTNTLMLTYGHTIAQLLPGAQRDFALTQVLKNVTAGVYTVKQELQDAQGRALDARQTTFSVGATSETGFGLTGTVAVAPKTIRLGETLSITSTATNSGNSALTNLPLKVVLVDPEQGTVVAQYPTTVASFAAGGSNALPVIAWTASGRVNATYLAVLIATIGTGATATDVTLATDSFQLLPQIAKTITATAGTPQAMTVTLAYTNALEVTVRDTVGAPFANATVTFAAPVQTGASVTFPNGNTAITDAFGRASVLVTANGNAGAFSVTASTPNAQPSPASTRADFALTNQAPQAAKIVVQSGTPQTALITKAYALPLKAVVTNNLSQPMSGVQVTFTALASSGASATFPAGATATTDATGVASVNVTANSNAGRFQVSASTSGVAGAALYDLTNRPAAAAALELVSGSPQSATTTQTYAQPLVARVKDELGNPMSGVLVTFTAPAASTTTATVSLAGNASTSVVTNSQGLATVSAAANTVAGNVTVTATAVDVSGNVSYTLTNKAVVAASIMVTSGTPQTTGTNTAFAQPLVATVKDNLGNVMPGVVVTFTAPSTGASATFPAGSTAVTGANGQASITAKANATAGSYVVQASAPNVTGTADFALSNTLVCGKADALTFNAVNNAAPNSIVHSNTVTIGGLGSGCTAVASITGGAYRIVRGATVLTTKASPEYSTLPQTVQDGDQITLELTTSAQASTTTSVTLTLDSINTRWSVTTAADATAPVPIPLLPDREPMRSVILALFAFAIAGLGWRALGRSPSSTRRGR